MISLDRAKAAAAYSLAAAVGRVGVILTTFAVGYDLSTVLVLMILTSGAVAAVGCADMVRLSPGERWHIDRSLLIDQVRYVWPLWATSVVGILNLQYDKILISGYFNPTVYAVYSCGAIELPIVALVTVSISHAIMPSLVPMVQADRNNEALLVWQQAARKCSLVIFPGFAFFLAVCPDLIVLFYGPDYARAAWPFGIYLFLLPLRVGVYSALLRAFGQTKPIAVAALIGLTVNVVLSTSLVFAGNESLLSFVGPAIGTVVATFCIGGYLLRCIGQVVGVPLGSVMRWKELTLTLILNAVAGSVVFVLPLPELPLVIKLGFQAAIFMVVLGVLVWYTRMLRDDERELLSLLFRMARRFVTSARLT